MDYVTGFISSSTTLPIKGGKGFRWVVEVDEGSEDLTIISGLGIVPDQIKEAFTLGYKLSIPVVQAGRFINYDPARKITTIPKGDGAGFKSASEEDSPRERAIRDAIVISEDTRRVFKQVWGFLPDEKSGEGIWAAYNSIFIYLSRK